MWGTAGTIKKAVRPRRLAVVALAGSLAAAGMLVTAQAAAASWLLQDTPVLPGALFSDFTAVSCTSPHVCMAAGERSGTNFNQFFTERQTNAGWSAVSIPTPAMGGQLLDMWCTSASACIAVGPVLLRQ